MAPLKSKKGVYAKLLISLNREFERSNSMFELDNTLIEFVYFFANYCLNFDDFFKFLVYRRATRSLKNGTEIKFEN